MRSLTQGWARQGAARLPTSAQWVMLGLSWRIAGTRAEGAVLHSGTAYGGLHRGRGPLHAAGPAERGVVVVPAQGPAVTQIEGV